MSANPFKKQSFTSYREWEAALVFFLLEQLRTPSKAAWLRLAEDNETRQHAAFMSLQLANLALSQGLKQEAKLREVFPALMKSEPTMPTFKSWLAQRWVDFSRLNDSLKFGLKNGVRQETHRLVA